MNLTYKRIPESDKDQLFNLIKTCLADLENPEYFIPFEEWELKSMFDSDNYAFLYGAYDNNKLVGMSQLYISEDMLADFKKEFNSPITKFVN